MPITDEQARAAGQAYEDAGRNKTMAAISMGLARSTFRDHLKAFIERGLELADSFTKSKLAGDELSESLKELLSKEKARAESLLLKLSEGAFHNPKGFREPATGKHADGRDRAPTLQEKLSIVAYGETFVPRLPSDRGEKKRAARKQHVIRSQNFQRRLDAYRAKVGNPVASHRAMNKDWGKLTDLQYLTGDIGLAA